jgi:hypothetical protein
VADQEREVEPQDAAHARLMRSILYGAAETPLVLKGGTALLVAYGLDRFSEDLDFDAPQKVNLLRIIERRIPPGFAIDLLDTPKNTDTVTRHRLLYASPDGQRKLKLEVSYRSPPDAADVRVFRAFASNPDDLLSRYRPDYEEDDLVPELVELETLATRICCHADELHAMATAARRRIDQLPTLKSRAGAEYTLWEHALEAIERVEKAGGSAAEVDWHAVSCAVIDDAIGENGQVAQTVCDALAQHSPAAASGTQQAEWRAQTLARSPDLEARCAAKVASPAASRFGPGRS